MKNAELWSPSKYVKRNAALRASRCVKDVAISSRLITDLVANCYDTGLREHCQGDLLDLGCGKAPLYILYREFAKNITCVDWANSPHDLGHADVLCDLNEPIPLPDASFDTIILSDVLEHLYRPQLVLQEAARLLRPGGKLILNVPFLYWLHEKPYDFFRYTRFALSRMADDNDLEVVELTELGGAFEVLADLLAKMTSQIKIVGRPIASSIQSCCLWFRRTRLGFRLSTSTAKQIPLGYFLVARTRKTA